MSRNAKIEEVASSSSMHSEREREKACLFSEDGWVCVRERESWKSDISSRKS